MTDPAEFPKERLDQLEQKRSDQLQKDDPGPSEDSALPTEPFQHQGSVKQPLDDIEQVMMQSTGWTDTNVIAERTKPNFPASTRSKDLAQETIKPHFAASTRPKGLALLINNYDFGNSKLNRIGSEDDFATMSSLLKQLGYAIKPHWDLTARKMISAVKKFVTSLKTGNYQSCIVVLMTHGLVRDQDRGYLFGTDNVIIPNQDFIKIVSKCKFLRNKPKIFIIQADDSVDQSPSESPSIITDRLPDETFIFYSTTPSSLFIQTLCKTFGKTARESWANIEKLAELTRDELNRQTTLAGLNKANFDFRSTGTKKFHFFSAEGSGEADKPGPSDNSSMLIQLERFTEELAGMAGDVSHRRTGGWTGGFDWRQPLMAQVLGIIGLATGGLVGASLAGGIGFLADVLVWNYKDTLGQLFQKKRIQSKESCNPTNDPPENDTTSWIEGYNLELDVLGSIPETTGYLDVPTTGTGGFPKSRDSAFYHNCSKPKGFALLISNEHFAGKYPDRTGSKIDLENVSRLLQALNYEIILHQDVAGEDIKKCVERFANSDIARLDSCIVYISTYAENGNFIGVDGETTEMISIFRPIVEHKGLTGKPKIFIIQACRGPSMLKPEQTLEVSRDQIRDCEWRSQEELLKQIPDAADTCVLHSTTPGYYNWCTDENRASWVIQTVCETFGQHAHEPWADLATLTTLVNKKLHQKFENQPLLLMNATMLDMEKDFHFCPSWSCDTCKQEQATAAARKWEFPVEFMGPAQIQFATFNEQAEYFLDEFWPNWNDYAKPKSYIFPPAFYFQNRSMGNVASFADDAELAVYNAISQLIRDEIHAPFIAVYALNVNNSKRKLEKILPGFYSEDLKETTTESNFLLIGREIGVVIIEIAVSKFNRKTDFKHQSSLLPKDYQSGLDHLQSTQTLISMLQRYTELSTLIDTNYCKILFTPNLEKRRYKSWTNSLAPADRLDLEEKVSGVIQWFKEDNTTDDFGESSLYSALKTQLQKCTPIATAVYESFAPIIVALKSIIVLPSEPTSIDLNRLSLTESELILQESVQKTKSSHKTSKLFQAMITKKTSFENTSAKVIFLTPDQQAALNGPPRQVILGAAGTGKTLVLKAKAIELLEKGESVAVLAPSKCMKQYEALFNNYGFTNFKTFDWNKALDWMMMLVPQNFSSSSEALNRISESIDEYIKRTVEEERSISRKSIESVLEFDNVFIDDAIDTSDLNTSLNEAFYALAFTMALARKQLPLKLTWATLDLYRIQGNDLVINLLAKNLLGFNTEVKESNYSVVALKQVMRCSENIFNAVYRGSMKVDWPSDRELRRELLPVLGHQIQGAEVITINNNFSTHSEAMETLWKSTKSMLDRFYAQGFYIDQHVSIIINEKKIGNVYPAYDLLARKCKEYILSKTSSSDLTEEEQLQICHKVVTINNRDELSSLEWPIVIFVNFIPRDHEKSTDPYQKYLAMSRATTLLADVSVTYDDVPAVQDEYSLD